MDLVWGLPKQRQPIGLLVFAHGAGADCRHANMTAIAEALDAENIATLRFNFPFMQQGKKRVDAVDVAIQTIACAAQLAQQAHPDIPLWLGGHSFGGRMATHAAAAGAVDCTGLVLGSFPLHLARKPSTQRATHLPQVAPPMLFLSGTRDDLADATLLEEVVGELKNGSKIHWLETANHSYVPLKRTRQNPLTVFAEFAQAAALFMAAISPVPASR